MLSQCCIAQPVLGFEPQTEHCVSKHVTAEARLWVCERGGRVLRESAFRDVVIRPARMTAERLKR